MADKKFNYIKFDEKELDVFCEIMDHEKRKVISFGDIKSACEQLGFEESYTSIKEFIKEIAVTLNGEITIDELKKGLLKKRNDQVEEMKDLFKRLDFTHNGYVNKNQLQIMIKEITTEKISDTEAEEMMLLLSDDERGINEQQFLKLLDMKISS